MFVAMVVIVFLWATPSWAGGGLPPGSVLMGSEGVWGTLRGDVGIKPWQVLASCIATGWASPLLAPPVLSIYGSGLPQGSILLRLPNNWSVFALPPRWGMGLAACCCFRLWWSSLDGCVFSRVAFQSRRRFWSFLYPIL